MLVALALALGPPTVGQAVTPRVEAKSMGDLAGLRNVFSLGQGIFSGSSPLTEDDFAALKRLGVKNIVSVDGARPLADLARKHGMLYVHLPHGYDGIKPDLRLKLAKAAQILEPPIYVHCHHGKHRGPAAAAVMRMSRRDWGAAQAKAFLEMAGTATNYAGLYEAVRSFRPPSERELGDTPSDFVEAAEVGGLVEIMVRVDAQWENLKTTRAAGYRTPPDHPDLKPANEAVILWELYREAQRLPEVESAALRDKFKAAEAGAKEAERLLGVFAARPTPGLRAELDRVFDGMGRACSSCHKEHRDY
jgi:protein tyrosine phosphatase (PTP) superfamily phosphohydrolase (DUF442 family)